MSKGTKHDGQGGTGELKDRWSLLPWEVVEDVVKVFTYGAKKYEDWNWLEVEESRYWDALERHLTANRKGEKLDKESGRPHLSHALACLMMIAHKQIYTNASNKCSGQKKM